MRWSELSCACAERAIFTMNSPVDMIFCRCILRRRPVGFTTKINVGGDDVTPVKSCWGKVRYTSDRPKSHTAGAAEGTIPGGPVGLYHRLTGIPCRQASFLIG